MQVQTHEITHNITHNITHVLDWQTIGLVLRTITGSDIINALVCKLFYSSLKNTFNVNVNKYPIITYTKTLSSAVKNSYTQLVKILLQSGGNPDMKSDHIIKKPNVKTRQLSEHHVKILRVIPSKVCITPLSLLMIATIQNDLDTMNVLIQYGAKTNLVVSKISSLIISIIYKNHNATKLLLLNNATTCKIKVDNNCNNDVYEDTDPLSIATINGNIDCMKCLIQYGNCLDERTSCKGLTPLHHAVMHNQFNAAVTLLDAGMSPNTCDLQGVCVLKTAMFFNSVEIVKLLIQQKACIEHFIISNHSNKKLSTKAFFTPLACATEQVNLDIIQILIDNGANVNVNDNYFGSPLISATAWHKTDLVKLLLKHDADVNKLSDCIMMPGDFTALMIAQKYKYYDIIDLLS
jgi:ankyrin repeat protein